MLLVLLLKSLYFFLPAYFANMAPVLFRWIPGGGKPIQEHWFGKNKTWRGIVAAVLTGILIFMLQQYLYRQWFRSWALLDYADFSLLLGFLLGAGAILGDLVKSYYKRKAGIPPGAKWLPWDQLDFVIGALLFSFLVYVPPAEITLIVLIASPFLHVMVNYIGYLLKIKNNPY